MDRFKKITYVSGAMRYDSPEIDENELCVILHRLSETELDDMYRQYKSSEHLVNILDKNPKLMGWM
jgi:hypothetical protein